MRLADHDFNRVALHLLEGQRTNVFSEKNNKTLSETLAHHKYAKFQSLVFSDHGTQLNMPLGQFLLELKLQGNPFYKRFLNPYGDELYSTFRLSDSSFSQAKGVYAYVVDGSVMYIGRCRDTMSKRIDQGYGKIHPKNCFLDGQATNCHLNAKITKVGKAIELWLCSLDTSVNIEVAELELIRNYRPPWNIRQYL
jgi:hypothetical protein